VADCGTAAVEPEMVEDMAVSITFEPLLGGDRQTEKHVAKARNRCKETPFEVSLS
jgi:hypothetical protein